MTSKGTDTGPAPARTKRLSTVNLIEVLTPAEDTGAQVVGQPIHWRREYYLPLRHGELRERLSCDSRLSDDERRLFLQVCTLLSATFHHEYHARAEQLKGDYEPFDPDEGCGKNSTYRQQEEPRDQATERLMANLVDLLGRANYHRLTQSQIEQAVNSASDWGVRLDVDFQIFERLEVYARGDVIGRRARHRWQRLFRPEEVDVPIYQRVVVIFQMRSGRRIDRSLDANALYIKLFKNIPKEDVDMMLPGGKARLSLFDRSKLIVPMMALMGWKLLTVALITTVAGWEGIFALAIFFGANGVRSLFGYLNTKNKYQLNLTRSLYFQNLDNSSGVLLRLTDEAEEQEFNETVLAYFLLWREAGRDGWTPSELDDAAETYLQRICGYGVDFDVDDSLKKLARLGMASTIGDGRWTAVGLLDSLRALDAAWDAFFVDGAQSRTGK